MGGGSGFGSPERGGEETGFGGIRIFNPTLTVKDIKCS